MGTKTKATEAEIRLGGGPDLPSGFRSLDELANNIRTISRAVTGVLENGPINRRGLELLIMDALPSPRGREKKVGIKQLRQVLDTLAELEELYVLYEEDEDE